MSRYNRGKDMPVLPPLDPTGTRLDSPGAAYTPTCDAGFCDDPTTAVLISREGAWMSMCASHAGEELGLS